MTRGFQSKSDEELMALLAQGKMQALDALYVRHRPMVGATLLRLSVPLSADEVDDLCQEVFLTLYQTAPRYQEQGRFKSWLCGIAAKKARSMRRRGWIRRKLLGQHAEERRAANPPVPPRNSSADIRIEISRALEMLPPHQREVMVLHVIEGLGAEEVAEILDISPNTVWTRLHRARKAMAASLRPSAKASTKKGGA